MKRCPTVVGGAQIPPETVHSDLFHHVFREKNKESRSTSRTEIDTRPT